MVELSLAEHRELAWEGEGGFEVRVVMVGWVVGTQVDGG